MSWVEACARKKQEQQDALPKEWLLSTPPPDNQYGVINHTPIVATPADETRAD